MGGLLLLFLKFKDILVFGELAPESKSEAWPSQSAHCFMVQAQPEGAVSELSWVLYLFYWCNSKKSCLFS